MSIRQLNRYSSAKAALALAAFAALAILTAACPGGGSNGDDNNADMDPDMQDPAAMQPMTDPDSNDMEDNMGDGMGMEDDMPEDPMTDPNGMQPPMPEPMDDPDGDPMMMEPAGMRTPLPEPVTPPERDFVQADFFTHEFIFVYEAGEIADRARSYPEASGSGCSAERTRSMQFLSTAEDRDLRQLVMDDLNSLRIENEFEVVEFELQDGDDACGDYRVVVRVLGDFTANADEIARNWNARIDRGVLRPRITPTYAYPPDLPGAPDLPFSEQPPYPPGILPESLKVHWILAYYELRDEDLRELNEVIRGSECVPDNDGVGGRLDNNLILEYDEALENPAASITEELRAAGLEFNRVDVYSAEDYDDKYGSETFINFLAPDPLQNFSFTDMLVERFGFELSLEGRRVAGVRVNNASDRELVDAIINNLFVTFPYLQDDSSVLYHARVHSDIAWSRQQLNESRLTGKLREFNFDTDNCRQAPPFNALFHAMAGAHTFFGDDLIWNISDQGPLP